MKVWRLDYNYITQKELLRISKIYNINFIENKNIFN